MHNFVTVVQVYYKMHTVDQHTAKAINFPYASDNDILCNFYVYKKYN